MAKNYSVDTKEKKVNADIVALSEKEFAEVQRYLALGYDIIDKPAEKVEIKKVNNEYIEEYLKDDIEGQEAYKNAKNEIIIGKFKKNGEAKTKGFANGLQWFYKNRPADASDALKAIEKAGEKVLKKFEKDAKDYGVDEKGKMTKDEYTRWYYWKNIFVR